MSDVDVDSVAEELLAAYRTGTTLPPLTSTYPGLTVDQAYAIQQRQTELRTSEGARIVGFKIGLTSVAMQQQLGVDQPDYGHLFTGMLHAADTPIPASSFLQPRAEPEIALILGRPLHGPGLRQPRRDPRRPHRLMYRDLWLELRFADGRTVSTDPRRWPRTFETEQPDPPFLYYRGAGGSERGWRSPHWLWGLPPPGPLAFVCRWPAGQDPSSGVEIDASLVLEAADRAVPVWPTTAEPRLRGKAC
jgi:hypothetical protein